MVHIRRSLQEIQYEYDTGKDRTTLENLVRAFRHIQQLPPSDPNSFFVIAGYHGEPFHGTGDEDYWGGYCNHGNVLFPTWHRAYLHRLENALRTAPGCQDLALPFWDECLTVAHKPVPGDVVTPLPIPPVDVGERPLPRILTERKFLLDNVEIDNPLYSYTLQQALADAQGQNNRYTKPVGYQTVRYPLSGLVGTEADRKATAVHNAAFPDPAMNTLTLNNNVSNWLIGNVKINPPPDTTVPDTTSVYSRFLRCLTAPNYTTFSNKVSAQQWTEDGRKKNPGYGNASDDSTLVTALEDPHNAIHLALGGFYQPGVYDASPIPGANGDMGENETAGFDPVFFLHHCFIDYVFWLWQKGNNLTKPGSLDVIKTTPPYPGTVSTGVYEQPKGTLLDFQTPLHPFVKPVPTIVPPAPLTSYDVTDIESQLGYTYGLGSLDPHIVESGRRAADMPNIVALKRVGNINRANIQGSFVIRLFATVPSGEEFEIGREAILSRWNVGNCANCQGNLDVQALVPIHEPLLAALKGYTDEANIKYEVRIDTRAESGAPWEGREPADRSAPLVEDL